MNYQPLLQSLAGRLNNLVEMRDNQLAALAKARRATVLEARTPAPKIDALIDALPSNALHLALFETEALQEKRLASLNKQIASLGAALRDIAEAAQQELEAK